MIPLAFYGLGEVAPGGAVVSLHPLAYGFVASPEAPFFKNVVPVHLGGFTLNPKYKFREKRIISGGVLPLSKLILNIIQK